jgi:tricarballylate dehydrogenase
MASPDIVVVGGGNAALCAALAAAEKGASVALLERAPEEKRGGNSRFTGGGFRMVHHGLDDIKRVVPDLSEADIARTDFGEYSREAYLDDLGRVTQYFIDPDLAETLVNNSTDTGHWLMGWGVKFLPNYGRQAYNHEGRFRFFGGVVIYANGGGAGLVESEYKAAARHGSTVRYGARATALLRGRNGVEGVRVLVDGVEQTIVTKAIVLACGGGSRDARAISGPAGTWQRFAAPATTPAMASAWRSTSAHSHTASGRARTQWPGSVMPAIMATSTANTAPATVTPIRSASW